MEPKYAKVYEALLERISGMSPGERLDSEVKLASSFKVSPMTVRRALMLLSQNGLTVGIPGRGTFVADRNQLPQQEDPLSTVASWNAAEYPQTHVKLVSQHLRLPTTVNASYFRQKMNRSLRPFAELITWMRPTKNWPESKLLWSGLMIFQGFLASISLAISHRYSQKISAKNLAT